MTDAPPPPRFQPGDRVMHGGQIFARTHPGGTAVVVEVLGPDHRGDYEYVVDACENFARFPDPVTNPMTCRTQWASYHVRPAWTEPDWENLT